MADITFEQVAQLAEQLTPDEQTALIERLRARLQPRRYSLTREQVLAEFERRKVSGVFENMENLRNKYANPALENLSDDQLLADIHEAATEWEKELDEFFGEN